METIDLASEIEQQHNEQAIAAVRRAKENTKSLPYTGVCYYCEEEVHSPKIFCDAQCRDYWQYERDRLKANAK